MVPDFWGVQAVDHSYAGSPFAADSLNIPILYLQTVNDSVLQETDTLYWEVQFGDAVLSYQVQIDDDSLFNDPKIDDTIYVSIGGGGYYYSMSIGDLTGIEALQEGFKYFWQVKPNYTFNSPTIFTNPAPSFWFGYVTAIDDKPGKIPKKFALSQNCPNPFNPLTRINYALPRASRVIIELYDPLGRKIKTILNEHQPAGFHAIKFNAEDLASGIYLYRIQADKFVQTRKMVLIK